jgi:hypothetical protein
LAKRITDSWITQWAISAAAAAAAAATAVIFFADVDFV